MKLFYTKRSPYARKVMIIAREKGIELDLVEVDLANKPEELLKANPVGRIPVLVDGDISVCDSSLICEYLEEVKPEPAFIPQLTKEKLKIKNLDLMAKGLTDVTVALFYEKLKHPKDFHPKFIENQEKTIKKTLRYFEEHVEELKEFHLATVGVITAIGYIIFRAEYLWPDNDCPRLIGWFNELSQRDSVFNTIPVG